jgi:hypothetical protein
VLAPIADLVRPRHRAGRMADQMQIRRFCVRWHTIVIAADPCGPARRVVTLTRRPPPWAERAMVVNAIDNADTTPVRPPRTGGLRGQAHQ